MLSRIWQEHKRFILIAGSGLAVFLLLNWMVSAYLHHADAVVRKAGDLQKKCRTLVQELRPYWDEKSRLSDLEKHEAQLRSELELPAEKDVEKLDRAAPIAQLNEAIDQVWGQAREKANVSGIALPDKLGPQDFGAEKGDSETDYKRYYSYLSVVRRALNALIDAGVAEIGRPELKEEELLPVVSDDNSVLCLLRPVRIRVSGSYESILKALKSLQGAGSFLQVGVASLSAKAAGEERLVKADLDFSGIGLVESSELPSDTKRPKGSGGKTGARRR